MTGALTRAFEERLQEIEAYLDLLATLEDQVRSGPPRIGEAIVTSQQQKILYSSVYVQIYNLVEATITWCVEGVCAAAADGGRWKPRDLAKTLRREWIRYIARTHADLNAGNRLASTVLLFDHLVEDLPVSAWEVEKSGGGNWDDKEIESIAERLGFDLHISKEVYAGVKRPIRDDKGPLTLVKDLRNQLAHGSLSFTECGDGVTVRDLADLNRQAAGYLREVVAGFEQFINAHEFLAPERRPETGA